MSSLQRRLPGVRFEVPPAALREALPRMDIALFVGFAASGPVDLPVAVESFPEFEAVYGGEIVLARDATSGDDVGGLLHPSVRGFFSQGGRRCWIVRVAAASATTTRFPLARMVMAKRADAGEPWRLGPALIAARCPGSWADGLRVATRLSVRTLRLRPVPRSAAALADVDVLGSAALALRSGELLRFEVDGVGPVQAAIAAMAPVASDADGRLCRRVRLRGAATVTTLSAATAPTLLVAAGGFDATGDDPVAASGDWADARRLRVRCRVPARLLPSPGAVLWLRFAGSAEALWFSVDEAVPEQVGGLDGSVAVELVGRLFRVDADVAGADLDDWFDTGNEQAAQWLQLGLSARGGDGLDFTLDALGMAAPVDADSAGLGIGRLPDDQAFFLDAGSDGGSGAAEAFELSRRDSFGRLTRRFPLAAAPFAGEAMLVPLGDEQDVDAGLGAAGIEAPALERDGLADFSWRLFAEPLLATQGSDAVADQAEALRFLGPQLQPLRGMHAAFGSGNAGIVDEPTLLAVPDAVHAGWQPVRHPPPAWRLLPPVPVAAAEPCDCAASDFADCAITPLAAPSFVRGADPDAAGSYALQWTEPEPGLAYALEESSDASFAAVSTVYAGAATRFDVVGKRPGSQFYRVRARIGSRVSPWSMTVEIGIGRRGYETREWSATDLLALHRLMLRTAAGRGDLLAVLSLPAHYDVDAAAAHAGALRDPAAIAAADAPPPIGVDEARALSHGALYHPWLATRRVDRVVAGPADGAACGQLAASALERGAWAAVANRPLRDVVAVSAAASRDDMQDLLDAQVNLVRASPHGFVLSTAETLSLEADWRPINVRRLMTLLRRLALRRGATYVFEPNGATLRRTVERGFEAVMDELFRRGAFAGADARAAYQVVVGDEVNTPARNDLGQFWVELKVAPALPLTFLTVRLARSGERIVAKETR